MGEEREKFYRTKRIGKKLLPVLAIAFSGLVIHFLIGVFTQIHWSEVGRALSGISKQDLLGTVALVALNYLLLSRYDLMGFRHILKERALPYKVVLPTALVCYALNFNLGAMIGGLAFRIRMYSGWGVSAFVTPLVALFTVLTTWLGYTFLLALILIFFPAWQEGPYLFSSEWVKPLGFFGLGLVGWYFYACFKGKAVGLKDKRFQLPPVSVATKQLLLASAQWILASSIVYFFLTFLGGQIPWGKVFFTYLIASIGGVIARIPAGIGVLEAIFLKMQPQIPASQILAALLCFRAVYYILPLALAIPGYLAIELIQKRKPKKLSLGSKKNPGRAIMDKNKFRWRNNAKHI